MTVANRGVVVVGGGAVGTATALELAQAGASVTLLERGPRLGWGCSAGNAGIVGASHVLPLATPQAILDGLRWLPRSDSPFGIRPRPRLLPWLARFVAAAAPRQVRRATRQLRELALASARLHDELAAAGVDAGYARRGLLNVYATPSAYRDAVRAAAEDERDGLRAEVLDAATLAVRFPMVHGSVVGGVFYPDEAHCDPLRFVQALGERATAAGVDVRTEVEVLGTRVEGGRVQALRTTRGELHADQVVLAAGVWSPTLLDGLELPLPVEAGKGYHVDVEAPAGAAAEHPIWFQEERIVATPLDGRLRLAGTLELSGLDERIDQRRVDAIMGAARAGLRRLGHPRVREIWSGMRPCTPDGLPVIGRAPGAANLILATGHGMWGLQLAPLTARLVTALATGGRPAHDLHPLRAERFARS
jgi:D-amino-acid dehydrogenase